MLTRRMMLTGALAAAVGSAGPVWAASWMDLGFRQVSLSRDVDRIEVLACHRFFERIRLQVTGNDVFVHTMTVHFANEASVRYRIDALIAEGRRSAAITLPGEGRRITHVDLAYRRIAGGGRAIVTLQGLPMRN